MTEPTDDKLTIETLRRALEPFVGMWRKLPETARTQDQRLITAQLDPCLFRYAAAALANPAVDAVRLEWEQLAKDRGFWEREYKHKSHWHNVHEIRADKLSDLLAAETTRADRAEALVAEYIATVDRFTQQVVADEAEVARLKAVLVELKTEYLESERYGQLDPQRATTYRWSLTRINYALKGNGDE